MTDTFYNFFLLAGCLCLVCLYQAKTKKAALLLVALAGIVAGLAGSVKVTGIVVAGSVFFVAAVWRFYVREISRREVFGWLGLFCVSSLATVYLLNPFFWPSFQDFHSKETVQEARILFSEAVATKRLPWHGREDFIADNRYPQIKNLSHVLEFPLLFLRWQNMMQRQSARGWEEWTGPRLVSLNETTVRLSIPSGVPLAGKRATDYIAMAAAVIFLVTGATFLIRRRRLQLPGAGDDSYLVPLMHFVVNYIFIAVLMRLNWDRYYLPTLLAFLLIAAVGIYVAASNGYDRVRRGIFKRRGNVEIVGAAN